MGLATYITFLFYETFLSEYFHRYHVVVQFARGCVCKNQKTMQFNFSEINMDIRDRTVRKSVYSAFRHLKLNK